MAAKSNKPSKNPSAPRQALRQKKLKLSKDTLRDLAAADRTAQKVRGGWLKSDLLYCN